MKILPLFATLSGIALLTAVPAPARETPTPGDDAKIRRIRFKEDDAQNEMTSKIYTLKHLKANDLVPFLLGAVKRYARNSAVDRINYSAGKQQLVAVTCPVGMMPYVDRLVATLDRDGLRDANGSPIDGTGILRYVYEPRFRSSPELVELMIKAGIPSNAEAGADQDAVVAYDSHTNLIYWKDSINKDKDLRKYLAWLDRPVPQVTLTLRVYEVRESKLRDLGIDYLAWKNGPGLDLFGTGFNFLSMHFNELVMDAVLSHAPELANLASGSYGGFFFAPAFDASFIRCLQQDGNAAVSASASLTVANDAEGSYEVTFSPEYQNLSKGDQDRTTVELSLPSDLTMTIGQPTVCLSLPTDGSGVQTFTPETCRQATGVLNFQYRMATCHTVERNNYGAELGDYGLSSSAVTVALNQEQLLTSWSKETEVEQTFGVPFICELPILKYLFGTTTVNREQTHYFLTVQVQPIHPDLELGGISGTLLEMTELFPER